MISQAGAICRARQMLGWTTEILAERSKVASMTALQAQLEAGIRRVSEDDLWSIENALRQADIDFTPWNAPSLQTSEVEL